jgi:cell division protein FtsZ
MQGEIRVTVIATGFDRQLGQTTTSPTAVATPSAVVPPKGGAPVIPFPANRPARVTGATPPTPRTGGSSETPRVRPQIDRSSQDLSDMEIPTFIRRQMD